MIFRTPAPQFGQCCLSVSITRLSKRAQRGKTEGEAQPAKVGQIGQEVARVGFGGVALPSQSSLQLWQSSDGATHRWVEVGVARHVSSTARDRLPTAWGYRQNDLVRASSD